MVARVQLPSSVFQILCAIDLGPQRKESSMTQHSRPALRGLIIATALLGVTACGGGDGAGSAQMKLSVGDAPVDGAQAVVVKFTGVELTGNSGSPVTINFAQPKSIDLLNESGKATAMLFSQP